MPGLPHDVGSPLRHARALGLAVAALVCSAGVAAQTPAERSAQLQLSQWAASCAACHGTQGQAIQGATVPGLAGVPAATTREQMLAFRDGRRPATVMHQLAKGFSEAQIAQLADYFASLPAGPSKAYD